MGNIGSLITIPLTVILVPWILCKLPYFRRPDVVGRRVAKAQLPSWVSLAELILFAFSEGGLVIILFVIEEHAHQALHQGRDILATAPPVSSAKFVFWLIQILAPVILALPIGMLLANFLSWLILPIRSSENAIMAEGVPGYTWHDLNYGLIRFSLLALPVCVILSAMSLMRL